MELAICSYNSNGLGTGRVPYTADLLKDHHFIFIQEHWLFEEQFRIFQNKLNRVNIHGVSGMDPTVPLVGRPYGGCCIIWQNKLRGSVTPVNCANNRICSIIYNNNSFKLLLICVYMPCENDNSEDYENVLNDVKGICESNNYDAVVFGGDFNTDFKKI